MNARQLYKAHVASSLLTAPNAHIPRDYTGAFDFAEKVSMIADALADEDERREAEAAIREHERARIEEAE